MDNKWEKCKARFPREIWPATVIDSETEGITMKKEEAQINTYSPIITYLFHCNTDVTCLNYGTAIKAVVLYVSDYITKSALKTHTIFETVKEIFQKNDSFLHSDVDLKEKGRSLISKVVNSLSAKMEFSAPMIFLYLLGNPDHYTNYNFVSFYWRSFVTEARSVFVDSDDQLEAQETKNEKLTLINSNSQIVAVNAVHDYIYRNKKQRI